MATKEVRGKATDGPVSRYINRKISTRITKFIIEKRIPIGPNGMTVISTALGLASAPLYLLSPPLAGTLAQISSILDGVDGELARALNKATKIGAFTDTVLDRLVDAAIALGAGAVTDPWLGALAMLGSLMVSYVHSATRQLFGSHPAQWGVKQFASRDVRIFAIFLGSLLYPLSPLALYAALGYVGLAGLGYTFLVLKKAWELFKEL